MLDLNFVRDNLPLVEEKLRQRGMDPTAVLKDFREVDVQRRQAITDAETMKARRNQASEEIAKLKKAKQDATAQMAETKQLREQIQEKERAANELNLAQSDFQFVSSPFFFLNLLAQLLSFGHLCARILSSLLEFRDFF